MLDLIVSDEELATLWQVYGIDERDAGKHITIHEFDFIRLMISLYMARGRTPPPITWARSDHEPTP
jgi:hypothetical protein